MLAEHPDINKLVLTGGTEAGRIAGGAAAKVFAHQTLELGGKTPVMVFGDFDVDQAVNYAAFGAFIGAGQTCVCASRHLVQASIYDEFVETLKAKTLAIRIGDPFDPLTQLGPVISARQRDRVLSYSKFGREDGARLVTGGGAARVPGHLNGYFVEPTVFADVKSGMRIFQEEVFGPFTSVTPFKDEADALRLANDSPFGLAAAIRTRDVARAHRVASAVKAGIVWINDHHRLHPAPPWGGVDDPNQILDRSAKSAIHFADLRRHDAGRTDCRICRRPVRAAVHLSDQFADFRAGVAGGGLCAGHESTHRLPLRAGPRPRRRNRSRLFDADRIRSAEDTRALAVDDGFPGGGRIPGDRFARLSDHPGLGMAPDVHHRRRRLTDRLVSAQESSRIAALA